MPARPSFPVEPFTQRMVTTESRAIQTDIGSVTIRVRLCGAGSCEAYVMEDSGWLCAQHAKQHDDWREAVLQWHFHAE